MRHNHLKYSVSNPALKNQYGERPRAQCRYLGFRVAMGISKVSDENWIDAERVRNGQKCVSCHRSAFSVPYF